MAKLTETLKSDAQDAALRVASTQMTNGVKAGLVKILEKKGGNSGQMEMFKTILDSEIGDAFVALLLGYGLNYAPQIKDNPKVVKIAAELRTQGMATGGNLVFGAAMDTLLPTLTEALKALPDETSSEEEEDEVPAKKTFSR